MTRAGLLVAISNLFLNDTIMREPIRKTVHYPGRIQGNGLRQLVTLFAKAFSQSFNRFLKASLKA